MKRVLTFVAIAICMISQMAFGQALQFIYDGVLRSYTVYNPPLAQNPGGHPLVIGLHGTGSDSPTFIATASLIQKANQERIIVACPDGLEHGLYTYFNIGGNFEELTNGTDDIGFIDALIDTMIKNYNIDTTRIYAMGFSNGSAMCYRVAAQLSHRIAAIGACSGQMEYEYCNPTYPVPIMHFHGLSDNLIPYEGNGNTIPPVEETIEIWRGINNCDSIPETIMDENGIFGRRWPSGNGQTDVILYTIEDQAHEWPRTGSLGISATDVIWDFLKLHTREAEPYHIETNLFSYDDKMRTYLVSNPPGNPGQNGRPLVIGLHCRTGSATGLLSYTNLLQKAQEENFIGVFPNALFHPIGTMWNVGSDYEWMTRGTDDVGFISALIDTMIENYDVDTTRIYTMGHSGGSMMSYRLAAELSHRIAAIGCVSAPMIYEFCDPDYKVPIIHFHGLSDTTMPYEGMEGDFVTYPPVDSCLALWQGINDCNATADTIYNDNGIVGKSWPSSDGNGDIQLYTVETCGHGWPDFDTYGISATDVIWDFLKIHTNTKTPSTQVEMDGFQSIPKHFKLYQNYPNPFNPSTRIRYRIFKPDKVILRIFNLAGQELDILVNEHQSAGDYEIIWYADNLPSGLYLYKMTVGQQFTETKKLILQK